MDDYLVEIKRTLRLVANKRNLLPINHDLYFVSANTL